MKKLFINIIFLFALFSCKEKFTANIQSPSTGYLVVEGFINSGSNPTTITLSRTTRLYDSVNIIHEGNAVVNILGENNEIFPLYATGNGVYVSTALNLNASEKYRLQIKTQDNKEYLSDLVSVKQTPDIDSISWRRQNGGLKIYVNTHDPQNNTKYYKWDYEETWEFHSAYHSSLIYQFDQNFVPTGVIYRFADHHEDSTIYKCWNTVNSTNINIGSSEKLAADVIDLPLVFIEPASIKLSVLYSIHIRQYALSRNAYLFYQTIKKNTEQLGSIFDAQPTELTGNIHCVTNPEELVIGFVDISEEKDKRIFIRNDELPGWNYGTRCAEYIVETDSIRQYGGGLYPTIPFIRGVGNSIVKFYATPEINCMDCTLTGSNVRPSFWP
ncbi:MAG: DUF4249 domain-containing protein [Ginsengibacter sp.]